MSGELSKGALLRARLDRFYAGAMADAFAQMGDPIL